jgi:protein involved in temperature-dependent protein secretion
MTEEERRRRVIGHLRAGNAEEAANELAASRDIFPGDGMLHHAIGLAFASRGSLKAAREQLDAAAKLSPDSPQILADLSQLRLAQGEAHEAIGLAEQALALDSEMALARFTLGRALFVAESTRQARRSAGPLTGYPFALIDGKTPSYLRALQEMETALDTKPPFTGAIRAALAFAYVRAGHYHAAAEQLRSSLAELPPGEEADRMRGRLQSIEYEIVREDYWAVDQPDLPSVQQAAAQPHADPEAKLRLAHCRAALGVVEDVSGTLAAVRDAGYAHVARRTGDSRLQTAVSDVHVLIGGGLECVIGGKLRFLPFRFLRSVILGEPEAWESARVEFESGEEVEAVVPTLYRLSLQSPSDLIQSGRFTQFSFAPGETRYAHAIGTRNLATESGVIPFTDVASITFA